jgi:hypothetical protein
MAGNYSSDSHLTSDEKLALARRIRQQHQRALGQPVELDPEPVEQVSAEERAETAWRESKQRELLDREFNHDNFYATVAFGRVPRVR